jgi:hypothetical protein
MHKRSRLLALPLVLLWAVVYLSSAAHFTLVQHHTCLVHGELVHGEGHGREGSAGGAVSSSTDEHVRLTQGGGDAHRADVHCPHSFLRRGTPLPAERGLSRCVSATPGVVRETARVSAEPQVAWLHWAPKASPPRA